MEKALSVTTKQLVVKGFSYLKKYYRVLLIVIGFSILNSLILYLDSRLAVFMNIPFVIISVTGYLVYIHKLNQPESEWTPLLKKSLLQFPGSAMLYFYITFITILRFYGLLLIAGLISIIMVVLPAQVIPEEYKFLTFLAGGIFFLIALLYSIFNVTKFYLGYTFAPFEYLYNQLSIRDSIKRSRELMQGFYLKTWIISLLMIIPAFLIFAIFYAYVFIQMSQYSGEINPATFSPYEIYSNPIFSFFNQFIGIILVTWIYALVGAGFKLYQVALKKHGNSVNDYKKQKIVRMRYYIPVLLYLIFALVYSVVMFNFYESNNMESYFQDFDQSSEYSPTDEEIQVIGEDS